MKAVVAMVTSNGILADVGTDHGYVPIALVQRQKIPGAIAMDINKGPLARAKENIAAAHLEDYIQTRLSDGVEELEPGEADSILIAGMGGELIIHILSEGEKVCKKASELILQPQSDIRKVREYLREHQYKIVDDKQNLFSLETDETNENYITNDTTQYQVIDEGQITGIIGTEPITNINIISPHIIDDNNLLMETFDQTNINQNNYQAENFVPIESVIEISSQPYEYIEEYKEAL